MASKLEPDIVDHPFDQLPQDALEKLPFGTYTSTHEYIQCRSRNDMTIHRYWRNPNCRALLQPFRPPPPIQAAHSPVPDGRLKLKHEEAQPVAGDRVRTKRKNGPTYYNVNGQIVRPANEGHFEDYVIDNPQLAARAALRSQAALQPIYPVSGYGGHTVGQYALPNFQPVFQSPSMQGGLRAFGASAPVGAGAGEFPRYLWTSSSTNLQGPQGDFPVVHSPAPTASTSLQAESSGSSPMESVSSVRPLWNFEPSNAAIGPPGSPLGGQLKETPLGVKTFSNNNNTPIWLPKLLPFQGTTSSTDTLFIPKTSIFYKAPPAIQNTITRGIQKENIPIVKRDIDAAPSAPTDWNPDPKTQTQPLPAKYQPVKSFQMAEGLKEDIRLVRQVLPTAPFSDIKQALLVCRGNVDNAVSMLCGDSAPGGDSALSNSPRKRIKLEPGSARQVVENQLVVYGENQQSFVDDSMGSPIL